MNVFARHRAILAVAGVIVAVTLIAIAAVLLASQGGKPPEAAQPSSTPSSSTPSVSGTQSPPAAVMTVNVYFHMGPTIDPAQVTVVTRTIPRTSAVATAALNQLLAGPTAAERSAGYSSFFSDQTANMLRSVRVTSRVAYADFGDFSGIIPNASSSYGSAALLAELDATLKQFGTVRSTVYSFDGDVDAFYAWLQRVPPTGEPGTTVAPRIDGVTVTSGQPISQGWLTLPDGAGTTTIAVRTTAANHVRLYLTPTGTQTAPLTRLLAEGPTVGGTFSYTWHYPDSALMAHLSVVATGLGGRAEQIPFNVMHP
jgi:Sporulation and spore germination